MKKGEERNREQSDESYGEISEEKINSVPQKNQGQKQNSNGGFKDVPLEILNHVKLNQTLDTPSAFIKGFVGSPQQQSEVNVRRENLKRVEKQLKHAFVEFYSKIRHLKSFR